MNIAIIDDDPVSIFLTEQSLMKEKMGVELRSFLSAEEALEELKRHGLPDLILLDLNMPYINGWQFLESFRHLSKMNHQTNCDIYILTSSLDLADIKKANENELVKGIIHKPISADDLGAILNQT